MLKPRVNLLYYKALLDVCFDKFIDLFQKDFIKQGDDLVLSCCLSRSRLKKIFVELLVAELKKNVKEWSLSEPHYFLIIGACYPKENLLLKHSNSCYFPEKLKKLLSSELSLKYLVREKNIKIDLLKFNEIFVEIFIDFFKDQRKLLWHLGGKKFSNVFFIQHSQLDCYSMFKSLKSIYGRSNCWNLHRERYWNAPQPILAINDLIDRYARSKLEMSKSIEFKKALAEVKQFADEKMKGVRRNG